MIEYSIPSDFEQLREENAALRAELAALMEECEYGNRTLIPLAKTSYLIQIGALRAELLQVQTDVRRARRKLALMREGARVDADDIVSQEFAPWVERLAFDLSEIERAKARFSSLAPCEDIDEIRSLRRRLAAKVDPHINPGQSEEAKAFWPSVCFAYATNDLFQLKALYMMAEDYPDSYDLPTDMAAVRASNDDLKKKVAAAAAKLTGLHRHPAFEWKRMLDSPSQLSEEQQRLRDEIARARVQKTALDDMLRSLEIRGGERSAEPDRSANINEAFGL